MGNCYSGGIFRAKHFFSAPQKCKLVQENDGADLIFFSFVRKKKKKKKMRIQEGDNNK